MGRHSLGIDSRSYNTYMPVRSHRRLREPKDRRVVVWTIAVCIGATTLTTNATYSEAPYPIQKAPASSTLVPKLLAPGNPLVIVVEPPKEPRELPREASRTTQRKSREASRTTQRKSREASRSEQVVLFALEQVGKRYLYGAVGPSAYDCSGLVLTAFRQVGITLPHYTGAIVKYGRKVTKAELTRGDLIFPTSGHVGIYLGNSTYVHAGTPDSGVRISVVYKFYTARRLL